MDVLYTAMATSTGNARNGHVTTDDGLLDLDVRTPQEMGGEGGATNPEQLFAAGYSACFHQAVKSAARREKADVEGSEVQARVGIGRLVSGGMGLVVALDVSLPTLPREQAQALVEQAHQLCPYSNATRGNIEVTLALI